MATDSKRHISSDIPKITASDVHSALIHRREIALLDVREEAFHAEGHPLFAANLPLSRIEIDARARLPRLSVPIVTSDDGEGYAEKAAQRLSAIGYSNVSVLAHGLQGWRDAGYEIFRDVNSPSKAFGELVEVKRHTPSLSAQQVKELIDAKADVMIVDARRYDEFHTMSIPTALSAPGAELVYRLQSLAEQPQKQVIVNCAGRTRSIIGTQSLINAGLPNRIAALRNGTIGWKLAMQKLEHGAALQVPAPDERWRLQAADASRRVADAAGVQRVSFEEVREWVKAGERTIYRYDVRSPEEFAKGHLQGFRSAPGGQLVQETDMFAAVRGARIVLADDDSARANMSASWLAQMNWEVYVLDGATSHDFIHSVEEAVEFSLITDVPDHSQISVAELKNWQQSLSEQDSHVTILDFSPSPEYRRGHVPGAWFALRSRIDEAIQATVASRAYVVTAWDEAVARFAWRDLIDSTEKIVYLLSGFNAEWQRQGEPIEIETARFASKPLDRYRRPYEGTDAPSEAMQAYLDWEYGLVEQLERDSTHGFRVL